MTRFEDEVAEKYDLTEKEIEQLDNMLRIDKESY